MAGVLNWSPDQWLPLSLRELTYAHDSTLLERWDHTATVATLLHNLTCCFVNANSKSRARPREFEYFHPFRKKKRRGLLVGKKNFQVLRMLGNAIAKG